MRPRESDSRPVDNGPATKSLGSETESTARTDIGLTPEQSRILHNWIADANHVRADRLAYVAVVEIAEGKYRSRTYLTLAAAQNAVERAETRGIDARVYLAELRPVGDLG